MYDTLIYYTHHLLDLLEGFIGLIQIGSEG